MNKDSYAPVSYFELLQETSLSGSIRGIASPSAGTKPCALVLVSGKNMISTTAANTFAAEAETRQIRLGWCGFTIGGLGQALAGGKDIELRCLVSGDVQAQ